MSRADLARMIADARRIVVFTGAGISTESGMGACVRRPRRLDRP
jgi:NAD-dependent SIR2 family protein deacetylase